MLAKLKNTGSHLTIHQTSWLIWSFVKTADINEACIIPPYFIQRKAKQIFKYVDLDFRHIDYW